MSDETPPATTPSDPLDGHVVAEPAKLLDYWMEWERGETPPGRVLSNLKRGGMHSLLEILASEQVNKADNADQANSTTDQKNQ